MRIDRRGALLVLLSGAAFGANPILAKLSYRDDATVGTFLSVRFTVAAIVLWLILRPRFEQGQLVPGLLLGLAYCGQAGFFFTAVSLQAASVTSVLQAVTPAVVAVGAVALRREPARLRIFLGVGVAALGTALVALGGGPGRATAAGVALSLASAVWYSGYILAGDRVVNRIDPLRLGFLIAVGGAFGFAAGSLALGQLSFHVQPLAWLWMSLSGVVATVVAVTALMAGIQRLGPSLAGLLTTFEPVATVTYAFLVFGERLSVVQAGGAALVLGAVVAVQLPRRRARPEIKI